MSILVTGCAGFIGRHLMSALEERGADVLGLDTKLSSDVVYKLHFENGWLPRFDVVFHCAGFVNGREGIDGSPAHLHTYNSMLDSVMFGWALKNKPRRFVYFSSSAAYPLFDQVHNTIPLCEGDIGRDDRIEEPEASYGWSKLHGEVMARDIREAGIPVTVLRPFSGYGADQDPRYPFRAFVDRARARQDPFEVWGDGSQVRDWVHISDVVGAALAAVENGVDGPVNVCTGIGTTFTDLARYAMVAADYQAEISYQLDKPAGVPYRVGDPTKLREFYTPTVRIEDALRDAVQA